MRARLLLAALLALGAALPAAAEVRVDGRALAEPKPTDESLPFVPVEQIPNHRELMRDIVAELAAYAKGRDPRFLVLARGGLDLLVKGRREAMWEELRDPAGHVMGKYTPLGTPMRAYARLLDGVILDGAFCGLDGFDKPTPAELRDEMLSQAAAAKAEGARLLAFDYCAAAPAKEARAGAAKAGILQYVDAAGRGLLDAIPAGRPPAENSEHVTSLAAARNLLPMLRSQRFGSKADWLMALADTNHDLLVVDAFHRGEALAVKDVHALKYKRLGSRRLVMAVMNLGIAADDRYYWKRDWTVGEPAWLAAPVGGDAGRVVVEYWAEPWKKILGTYIKGLMDLGFDGVVLDGLDAHRHFERIAPLG